MANNKIDVHNVESIRSVIEHVLAAVKGQSTHGARMTPQQTIEILELARKGLVHQALTDVVGGEPISAQWMTWAQEVAMPLLKGYAKNKEVEPFDHWENGNYDDSFNHGQDITLSDIGKESRAVIDKAPKDD